MMCDVGGNNEFIFLTVHHRYNVYTSKTSLYVASAILFSSFFTIHWLYCIVSLPTKLLQVLSELNQRVLCLLHFFLYSIHKHCRSTQFIRPVLYIHSAYTVLEKTAYNQCTWLFSVLIVHFLKVLPSHIQLTNWICYSQSVLTSILYAHFNCMSHEWMKHVIHLIRVNVAQGV